MFEAKHPSQTIKKTIFINKMQYNIKTKETKETSQLVQSNEQVLCLIITMHLTSIKFVTPITSTMAPPPLAI
jgi:hypothetical protein